MMDLSRRKFLRAGGLVVLGLGGGLRLVTTRAEAVSGKAKGAPSGTRWAMAIDTNRCAGRKSRGGCNACADACHKIHNVPPIEGTKEEIKWIWEEPLKDVFHERVHEHTHEGLLNKPVMVMCNHCDNPPCVRVCPTQATWKRPDGIVMMDQHRCIGCRYCMVGCPYGARSFNWSDPRKHLSDPTPDYPTRTKGVVEKCTFCAERLARGKMPSCVEACKAAGGEALVFGDLSDPKSEISRIVSQTLTARRKEHLGTRPQVYYEL
jgi:Fe-S-cluster-containing dehydrogenase component